MFGKVSGKAPEEHQERGSKDTGKASEKALRKKSHGESGASKNPAGKASGMVSGK